MARLFGLYVSAEGLAAFTAHTSEWQAFKLLLPSNVSRLFYSPSQRAAAYAEVHRMALQALRDAESKKQARDADSADPLTDRPASPQI
jgi:hypothetical protein